MTEGAYALIDTGAIRHNLARVREAAPAARVMAVIKANGYGHGLLTAAAALAGADSLAVARLQEALDLRAAGHAARVVLLEGVNEAVQVARALAEGFELVVHSAEQLALLESAQSAQAAVVWLKIDTGMKRLGIEPEAVPDALRRLQALPGVRSVAFLTHLAAADEPGRAVTTRQLRHFETALAACEGERSIANSAGVLAWPQSHADWVRPGIMLYGISPMAEREGAALGLVPAMTLRSRLIAVKRVRRGDAVGYSARWRTPRDTMLGVVGIGYGDGYPRGARSGTPVLVNGRRVKVAGTVSMDMLTVDLGPGATDRVGDTVTLWGEGLPAEEVARHAGTIGYELVARITGRVALQNV